MYEERRRKTLIRMGVLVERVREYGLVQEWRSTIQDYHSLWPIPQEAIDANFGAALNKIQDINSLTNSSIMKTLTSFLNTLLFFLTGILSVPMQGQTSTQVRPNIIFIMADDLGIGDVGCYGQKYLVRPTWTGWPRKVCVLPRSMQDLRYVHLHVHH